MERDALVGRLFELVRESQRETDRFDQKVADYLGVTRTEGHCLDILEEFGSMTAGRLAELSHLTTGAITKIVDRLERAGHVSRTRDSGDRRRVIIDVTPSLRRLALELYAFPGPQLEKFKARFSDRDLEVLIDFFERGGEYAEARSARLDARIRKQSRSSGR
jgi:DNA-binding MarR family transcriptional regulator